MDSFCCDWLQSSKDEYLKMGFIGIRQAVECLFRKRIEFRIGDPSKHEAPVKARDLKKLGIKSPTFYGSHKGVIPDSQSKTRILHRRIY